METERITVVADDPKTINVNPTSTRPPDNLIDNPLADFLFDLSRGFLTYLGALLLVFSLPVMMLWGVELEEPFSTLYITVISMAAGFLFGSAMQAKRP